MSWSGTSAGNLMMSGMQDIIFGSIILISIVLSFGCYGIITSVNNLSIEGFIITSIVSIVIMIFMAESLINFEDDDIKRTLSEFFNPVSCGVIIIYILIAIFITLILKGRLF